MAFIFDIWMSVPPSAVPHGDVEWFDPTARTGDGYFCGFFTTAMMSSTVVASTTTAGCEVMLPNQLVTVAGMERILYHGNNGRAAVSVDFRDVGEFSHMPRMAAACLSAS